MNNDPAAPPLLPPLPWRVPLSDDAREVIREAFGNAVVDSVESSMPRPFEPVHLRGIAALNHTPGFEGIQDVVTRIIVRQREIEEARIRKELTEQIARHLYSTLTTVANLTNLPDRYIDWIDVNRLASDAIDEFIAYYQKGLHA